MNETILGPTGDRVHVREPKRFSPEQVERMVRRGAELLHAQVSGCRCGCKSERRMRLDLAAQYGVPDIDLVCIAIGAGIRYERERAEERAA